MAINWYPGHMVKTKRQMIDSLKLVDAVIEIRDARIPKSSKNPDIEFICKDKPRIILLNKSDLSDDNVNKSWIKLLSKSDTLALSVNCQTGLGLNKIKPSLELLLKEKLERQKNKGILNVTIRAMVVGIPNVGKSTFINKMAQNAIAKTGDKPGVTKAKQWIKTKQGIELLDTPGVLWPKLDSEETQLNLAFTGAIKDEILDIEELALKLVGNLTRNYKELLKTRYKAEDLGDDPLENMEKIARKRGCLLPGNNIDYNRMAVILLDEFRGGKIGKISLEKPDLGD
ncbi:MAG: ribosome biogenesis GTPase YlqF [Bacillota bacterium]|nr:ribosome biogenesis GTPase YlqF [Bacillota bacterium]